MNYRIIMRHILLMLTVLFVSLPLSAQKLTVESMEYLTDDATARDEKYQRVDGNENIAGLVKVFIPREGVEFDGGMVIDQRKWAMGEYWVWMADGATKLNVRVPGFHALEVNFREYPPTTMVHSKNTYKLVINVPTVGQPQDDGKGILAFQIEPKNARLTINGEERPLQNGQYSQLVDKGTYQYEISAEGYTPQRGTLLVDENTKKQTVNLVSTMTTLQVSCATVGAQIYLDNELQGTAPQTLTLSKGAHRVEARLQGYRPGRLDITVGENEKLSREIPALTRLTGKIAVSYLPFESEVYVDGSKVGVTPGTFSDIGVGSHKVEIRKDGYASATKTVEVLENQTADVSGSLTATATPITNNNVSNASSGGSVQSFTVKGVTFKMVRVEGGTFQMGATSEQGGDADGDEKPAHNVTLSSFMIGETEVTQELWEAVMGINVRQQRDKANKDWSLRGEGKNYPMYYISWDECQDFVRKLNSLTGQKFRLPTEAEWEFAARGGNKSQHYKYSGGNTIGDVAWYDGNISSSPHPVGTKKANELGIYDMSGNVWEWCEDWYGNYSSTPQTNPKGPDKGSSRVLRGGSWHDIARYCRVSRRDYNTPSRRDLILGFRLAL